MDGRACILLLRGYSNPVVNTENMSHLWKLTFKIFWKFVAEEIWDSNSKFKQGD